MKNILMPKIFQPYHCNDIVRVGKYNDGGYLINKLDIKNSRELLSFGIGEDISFETDFQQQATNCSIDAYDNSIYGSHKDFFTGDCKLHNENISADNINVILDKHKEQLFLKCDIDGAEYEILYDLCKNSHRFTGITIEFHGISKSENYNNLINFIAKFEMRLIHTHVNNYMYFYMSDTNTYIPEVIELTFSSSKTNTSLEKNTYLPHILDMPNNPSDDDFNIIF
jgi:hypothetical protein